MIGKIQAIIRVPLKMKLIAVERTVLVNSSAGYIAIQVYAQLIVKKPLIAATEINPSTECVHR